MKITKVLEAIVFLCWLWFTTSKFFRTSKNLKGTKQNVLKWKIPAVTNLSFYNITTQSRHEFMEFLFFNGFNSSSYLQLLSNTSFANSEYALEFFVPTLSVSSSAPLTASVSAFYLRTKRRTPSVCLIANKVTASVQIEATKTWYWDSVTQFFDLVLYKTTIEEIRPRDLLKSERTELLALLNEAIVNEKSPWKTLASPNCSI
jgi:hypothetical protein